MTKSRTLITVSISLGLIVIVIAAIYIQRNEQQQQAGDVQLLIDKGIAQFRQEQYELSLETLGSIPHNPVEDWHIPYYMGSAQLKLRNYEAAATQLEQALALNNKEKNVLFALGVVYYKLGNLGLSKSYFALVLELDPGNEEAKGLMDIMASLERFQTTGAQQETPADSAGVDDH